MLFQSSCGYAAEKIRGENAISKETMTLAPEYILNLYLTLFMYSRR